ncbi:MAG: DUF47 family protein [Brachybacterium sp.]|nr:DUF47 family protein [Brachybacterium sp.]
MRLFASRHERPLFTLFADAAQLLSHGAEILSRTLGEGRRERPRIAAKLHEDAVEVADLTRRIANRLADSLITPFEADVLHALALAMSDAVDAMERCANLVVRYRLRSIPTSILEAAQVIERAATVTAEATWQLGSVAKLSEFYVEMRRLENHADQLVRQALTDLYDSSVSTADMLRMRDVIQEMERAARAFETIARTTDLLRVKDS